MLWKLAKLVSTTIKSRKNGLSSSNRLQEPDKKYINNKRHTLLCQEKSKLLLCHKKKTIMFNDVEVRALWWPIHD